MNVKQKKYLRFSSNVVIYVTKMAAVDCCYYYCKYRVKLNNTNTSTCSNGTLGFN